MSIARKVESTAIDVKALQGAAEKMNLRVAFNSSVAGYYGNINSSESDIVVKTPNSKFEVGFKNLKKGGCEIIADYHGGHVQKTLNKLMPAYYKSIIEKNKRFRVTETVETKDHIILKVRR